MKFILLFASFALLASCQQFTAPDSALLMSLPSSEAVAQRRVSSCVIESEAISGEFRAAIVSSGAPGHKIRVQLFPDFGGKILDLVATPDAIDADWPFLPEGRQRDEAQGLAHAIGISLLESATPLSPQRVLGAAATPDGHRLQINPVFSHPDLQVWATFTDDGRVVRRDFQLGRMKWSQRGETEYELNASGFSWTVVSSEVEHLSAVPDSLFHLRPSGPPADAEIGSP